MFTTLTNKIKFTIVAFAVATVTLVAMFTSTPVHALTLSDGTTISDSAFLKIDSHGQPARWDTCAPAYWKIYNPGLPKGGRRAIVIAVHLLKKATGIKFVYAGAATSAEFANPPAHTIVIGFTSSLPSTRAGVTRDAFVGGPNDSLVILSSQVKINRLTARRTASKPPIMLHVLLHELGHAVGLAHSPETSQVMYRYAEPIYRYQPADLLKLRAVGVGTGCPTLAA